MADLIYDCEGDIFDPSCDPCLSDIELGRVRHVAFIRDDYYQTLKVNPGDANLWAQGIQDKKIYVLPETQGSYDGGSPIEKEGYGNVATRVVGYNHTLSYKDPVLLGNQDFYKTIQASTKFHVAFGSEKTTRISSNPGSLSVKSPIAEDFQSEVVWDNEFKWAESKFPVIFPTPDGIFTCAPIAPTPVGDFDFYYGFGTVPTSKTEIEAGDTATAVHNQKATVPDFGNTTDDTLWYAEPVTEPTKTKWWNTSANYGNIEPSGLFIPGVVIDGYRLYKSGYVTSFDAPEAVEFRVS